VTSATASLGEHGMHAYDFAPLGKVAREALSSAPAAEPFPAAE
jgi:hypothetical protein